MRKLQKEEACEPKIYSINNFSSLVETLKKSCNRERGFDRSIK